MNINKTVILAVVIELILVMIMFMFDPTHNYPTMDINIELNPNQTISINVPTSSSGFLKWAGSLYKNPLLWLESNVGGISINDIMGELLPNAILGIFPSNETKNSGTLKVTNLNNYTTNATIIATMAPSPKELGNAKMWWWIIFIFLIIIANGFIAMLKPSIQLKMRPLAEKVKRGDWKNNVKISKCYKLRDNMYKVLSCFCLRKSKTQSVEMA